MKAIAEPEGWQVQLSDKGGFAVGAMNLFGGFTALCQALLDAELQKVFFAYQSADSKAPGKVLKDRRRYLTLGDLSDIDGVKNAVDLLEGLEGQRVLVRGLVLKCHRCRHTDFFRADASEPAFTCPRCSLEQRADRYSWLGAAEPEWHYRLDEVVFQFLSHRGEIPMLVAHERFSRSHRAVAIVPEIELGPADDRREIDFAATDGSELWLGEAFTGERYEPANGLEHDRLTKLHEAAELLNAQGVLLATSADSLNSGTRARAQSVISGTRPRLEIIEAARCLERPERPIHAGTD